MDDQWQNIIIITMSKNNENINKNTKVNIYQLKYRASALREILHEGVVESQ